MTFGFKVIGDSGFLQIDDDFSTYVIVQSGTVANGGFLPRVYESDTFIFVTPTNMGVGVWVSIHTDDAVHTNIGGSADYIIIKPLNTIAAPAHTHGIDVFNSVGGLVFSSDSPPPLRLVRGFSYQSNLYSYGTNECVVDLPNSGFKRYINRDLFTVLGTLGDCYMTQRMSRINNNRYEFDIVNYDCGYGNPDSGSYPIWITGLFVEA